jgi:hypothetical protein
MSDIGADRSDKPGALLVAQRRVVQFRREGQRQLARWWMSVAISRRQEWLLTPKQHRRLNGIGSPIGPTGSW